MKFETLQRGPRTSNFEDVADYYIQQGDNELAVPYLEALIKEDGRQQDFARMKLACMELYELAYSGPSTNRVIMANDAYGMLTDNLAEHAAKYSSLQPQSAPERIAAGIIAEDVIIALGSRREITEESTHVIVPASRQDDLNNTDFYHTPIGTGSISDGHRLQVKLLNGNKVKVNCDNQGIVSIGLNELDEYVDELNHPNSLMRLVLREIHGLATDTDIWRLDRACERLDDLIITKANELDRGSATLVRRAPSYLKVPQPRQRSPKLLAGIARVAAAP